MENDYINKNSSATTNGDTNATEYEDNYYVYPYEGDTTREYFYTDYMYESYVFEKVIYVFLWEILALLITTANVFIMIILFRRSLRNSSNVVLMGIAVAETLTVLVTLPAYIYAYRRLIQTDGSDSIEAYIILSKDWCNVLMFSKFYLSKAFHTVSIWLHCYLGFQRFFSIYLPFKAKMYFTLKKTLAAVIGIYVCAPCLHLYHAINFERARGGMCEWSVWNCGASCVYLWLSFLLMHLVPCVLLVSFTVTMVFKLFKSTSEIAVTQQNINRETFRRRNETNITISKIVITVVIVFLIPEIPYGVFLAYCAVLKQTNRKLMPLQTIRAFHAGYEVLLTLSYCAKFWIYVLLNKTFQKELVKLFHCCKIKSGNKRYRLSISPGSPFSQRAKKMTSFQSPSTETPDDTTTSLMKASSSREQ